MAPDLSKEALRQRASWIRDVLDPQIARDGPEVMSPDDVLTLHELFQALLDVEQLSMSVLRYSRIHMAVTDVCGKATRWPKKLAEGCDHVVDVWTERFGRLTDVRPRLCKSEGRLNGICSGLEMTRDGLIRYWTDVDPDIMDKQRAMKHGCLDFKPGDWWINGMFAFHAGIIDLQSTGGGICADKNGAYAVVMAGSDEIHSESPEKFKYRCRPGDPGRFRITSVVDFRSRNRIRVLRSHTLASLWSPSCGIRYDGIHKVTGWTVKPVDPSSNQGHGIAWEITLERVEEQDGQESFEETLKHPNAEETDDYMEYKRMRRGVRDQVHTELSQAVTPTQPVPDTPIFEIAQSPPMSPMAELPTTLVSPSLQEPTAKPASGSPRRKSIAPPPSPGPTSGPGFRTEREPSTASPRTLTASSALRKSLSTNNPRKKSEMASSRLRADSGAGRGSPNHAGGRVDRRSSRNSAKGPRNFARSISRLFDGQVDEVPESPFGSTVEKPSYFPLTKSQPEEDGEGNKTPFLRQPEWGNPEPETPGPAEKSRSRKRRDRAVYEALEKADFPEPSLFLAALNEVWDDFEDPEYPDMVLEDMDSKKRLDSDNYLLRIPPGGIDLYKFFTQQAGEDEFFGRHFSTNSEGSGRVNSESEHSHEIGGVLRDMSFEKRRRVSIASCMSDRSTRSSAGLDMARITDEAHFNKVAMRPGIVRFGTMTMLKRQSVMENVDEGSEVSF
ncbi:uncharacterized protein J3D65DRAFT_604485 [Phyllosticta citribraziliensis]|uniref:YDG domain-containing protein n=1 Tax=Phyllosticta citribraziliensis TaxID=989973 RepID=A0ABR1LIN8_9PEZI